MKKRESPERPIKPFTHSFTPRGLGTSLSSPKSKSGFRKKTALALGVGKKGDLLYIFYSGEQGRKIESNQGENQLALCLLFPLKKTIDLGIAQSA